MTTALYPVNTVVGIRQQVRALLLPELGTFVNGTKAIWVEPPKSPEPGTGLHIYIKRYYTRLTSDLYQWQVSLVQRDDSESGLIKLDSAIQKMRKTFYNRREVILPYAEDVFPQANFYLPFNQSAYPL